MNLKHSMLLNLKMIKLLQKASPGYLFINLINMLANTLFFVIQTLFFKYVIDTVAYSENSLEEIAFQFLLYYVSLSISYILNLWVNNYYNEREKVKINLFYKRMIYTASSKKSAQKYNSEENVSLLENAVYSDGSCLYAFADKVLELINSIILFLFFIDIFGSLHPYFIVSVILSALKNLICRENGNKARFQIYQNNLPFEKRSRSIYNIFYLKQFARELRVYSIGDFFIDKYKKLEYQRWEKNKSERFHEMCINMISEGIDLVIYWGNLAVLGYFLLHEIITVGEFSLVLTNFKNAANNLQGIILFFSTIYDEGRYANDIISVAEDKDHKYPAVNFDNKKKCAVFKNVCFSYDGVMDVLKNINIELPLNNKIAIVGENGAGKSTFIKILLGIYTPTQGKIEYFFDEGAERSLDLFRTILQEYQLFALSIKENLIAGREQCTDRNDECNTKVCGKCETRVEEALQFSGLWNKVEKLPEKEDTVLTGEFSENGVYLSGGEKQKLAIARAYISEHPILILDEPSSNLDPIAENALIDKINKLSSDKAVIMITHNLSYTRNVDLVIMFDHGEIAEYGSPQTLMKRDGKYSKMMKEWSKVGDGM